MKKQKKDAAEPRATIQEVRSREQKKKNKKTSPTAAVCACVQCSEKKEQMGGGQPVDHNHGDGASAGNGEDGDEDSWENSLDDRMRELKPPSHASPPAAPPPQRENNRQGASSLAATAHRSQTHGEGYGDVDCGGGGGGGERVGFIRDDATAGGYSLSDSQTDAIANAVGYVDPLLREALTAGGARRLDVLKIDVEVARFVKDRTQRVFEYDGSTSYHRLIAHKIATHYGLISHSAPGRNGGDKAVLEKPPPPPGQTHLAAARMPMPAVRLQDIGKLDDFDEDGGGGAGGLGSKAKVMVMKRGGGGGGGLIKLFL